MTDEFRVADESILLQAGSCAVTILPRLGGKFSSISIEGNELLQLPLNPYALRTRTMSFEASDASGWDECLPSVGGCVVEAVGGPVSIPDHGDLWRVEWSKSREQKIGNRDQQDSVSLSAECFSLPLRVERTATLTETENSWRLKLDYAVTNHGDDAAPWSWSAHPLFVAEAGDRIVLPDSIRELTLAGGIGDRLGKGGRRLSWPLATLPDGRPTDLSLAVAADAGIGDKLFAGPLATDENWCALERPKIGLRIKVGFDPAKTPYLGIWACYGGWPERPGPKQICAALEPSTAAVDSLAETGPWSLTLVPGASFEWPVVVDFERL
jgi:galactose mutarotase-like enzyme